MNIRLVSIFVLVRFFLVSRTSFGVQHEQKSRNLFTFNFEFLHLV